MPNDVEFKVDEYLDDIVKMFGNLQKECYSVERKAMATGGRYISQQVRRSYNQWYPHTPKHHDKSGMPGLQKGEPENLKKSIRSKAYRKPKLGTYITSTVHAYNPYNPEQKKVLYGIALGKGYTLEAKDPDKYLTFIGTDGKWAKKKSVTIPKRPWISDPAERAAMSTEIVAKMNDTVAKYLKKLENNPNYVVKYPDDPNRD